MASDEQNTKIEKRKTVVDKSCLLLAKTTRLESKCLDKQPRWNSVRRFLESGVEGLYGRQERPKRKSHQRKERPSARAKGTGINGRHDWRDRISKRCKKQTDILFSASRLSITYLGRSSFLNIDWNSPHILWFSHFYQLDPYFLSINPTNEQELASPRKQSWFFLIKGQMRFCLCYKVNLPWLQPISTGKRYRCWWAYFGRYGENLWRRAKNGWRYKEVRYNHSTEWKDRRTSPCIRAPSSGPSWRAARCVGRSRAGRRQPRPRCVY